MLFNPTYTKSQHVLMNDFTLFIHTKSLIYYVVALDSIALGIFCLTCLFLSTEILWSFS